MSADVQPAGSCDKCDSTNVTCRYNHFDRDDLQIDSWEHKCPNCGFRDTTAYRSDEEDSLPADGKTDVCPYCGRRGET